MAETRPPHYDMEPLQVLFVIPKNPPPRLKDPKIWSPEFIDFIEKCLQKDPSSRSSAKQLLNVFFFPFFSIFFYFFCCFFVDFL